jgi:hypothetical protein
MELVDLAHCALYTPITHWIKGGVEVQYPSRNENATQLIQFAFGHFTDRGIIDKIILPRWDKRLNFIVLTPIRLCLIQSENIQLQDKFTALKFHLAFCKILYLFTVYCLRPPQNSLTRWFPNHAPAQRRCSAG